MEEVRAEDSQGKPVPPCLLPLYSGSRMPCQKTGNIMHDLHQTINTANKFSYLKLHMFSSKGKMLLLSLNMENPNILNPKSPLHGYNLFIRQLKTEGASFKMHII